jgi:hypothetical protein
MASDPFTFLLVRPYKQVILTGATPAPGRQLLGVALENRFLQPLFRIASTRSMGKFLINRPFSKE